jgi:hypothetical protein
MTLHVGEEQPSAPENHDNEDFVDPWAVKRQEARQWINGHRRLTALVAGGAAVALGLTVSFLGLRGGDGDTVAANPGQGVANGKTNPNTGTVPEQNSNQAGAKANISSCTVTFAPTIEDGHTVYRATPQVTGDNLGSHFLYTLVARDDNTNAYAPGVTSIDYDPTTEVPDTIAIVDTYQTSAQNNPSLLGQPLGDGIPFTLCDGAYPG